MSQTTGEKVNVIIKGQNGTNVAVFTGRRITDPKEFEYHLVYGFRQSMANGFYARADEDTFNQLWQCSIEKFRSTGAWPTPAELPVRLGWLPNQKEIFLILIPHYYAMLQRFTDKQNLATQPEGSM